MTHLALAWATKASDKLYSSCEDEEDEDEDEDKEDDDDEEEDEDKEDEEDDDEEEEEEEEEEALELLPTCFSWSRRSARNLTKPF